LGFSGKNHIRPSMASASAVGEILEEAVALGRSGNPGLTAKSSGIAVRRDAAAPETFSGRAISVRASGLGPDTRFAHIRRLPSSRVSGHAWNDRRYRRSSGGRLGVRRVV
jgi:hypothetical protein